MAASSRDQSSDDGHGHQLVTMDVDLPFAGKGSLKRSNSAPMINVLNLNTREEILIQPLFEPQPRARRFSSGGFAPFGSTSTSPYHLKTPSRISQIKQEEGMDVANREAAHEKEVRSALQMSQSCEDLTLITLAEPDAFNGETSKRPRCFTEPLHIFPSAYPLSSSPSPTRLGKQCFSPSMQQPVRNTSFCTSPVPSPTRKSVTRRSLSPIALRPSQFPMKRKYENGDKMDCYASPQKRFHGNVFALDRTTNLHTLAPSLSSNSLDDSSSPGDQAVPMSSANTPESVSSRSGSPFKPVETSDSAMMMQDSEPEPPTPTSPSVDINHENLLA